MLGRHLIEFRLARGNDRHMVRLVNIDASTVPCSLSCHVDIFVVLSHFSTWCFSMESFPVFFLLIFRCLFMFSTRTCIGGGGCQSRSDSVGDIERSDGPTRVGIAPWNHPPVWWFQPCHTIYSCRSWWLVRQRSLDAFASFSKVIRATCSEQTWQRIRMRATISFCLSSRFARLVEFHPNATWLVILQETTRINWAELVDLTQRFDPDKVIGSFACASKYPSNY